jgi:hypothetical protein
MCTVSSLMLGFACTLSSGDRWDQHGRVDCAAACPARVIPNTYTMFVTICITIFVTFSVTICITIFVTIFITLRYIA